MKWFYNNDPSKFWGFMTGKSREDVIKKIIDFNPEIKKEKELRLNRANSRRMYVYSPYCQF